MANTENLLSVTLLPEAVNAFALTARDMRAMTYPDEKSAMKADVTATWLEFLARDKSLAAMSREPVLLIAMARLACNGNERKRFRKLCDEITLISDKAKNGTVPPGVTADARSGTKKGFRIDKGGVAKTG